jgi:uncharacterized integral membrane protein
MHAIIIIILILAILLVIFTLQNSVEISINVFFWEIPNAPLVLVLLSCVLLGYIISAIYFYPRVWKLKKDFRKASKSKQNLEEELEEYKQVPESSETHPEGIELETDDDEDEKKFFGE